MQLKPQSMPQSAPTIIRELAVRMTQIAVFVGCSTFVVLQTHADSPTWGSDAFLPSTNSPVGWRGDGNGRYPAAQPPIHWGKHTQAVQELRGQGKAPGANDTGAPLTDGVIRDWLTLGPVEPGKLDAQESSLKPCLLYTSDAADE